MYWSTCTWTSSSLHHVVDLHDVHCTVRRTYVNVDPVVLSLLVALPDLVHVLSTVYWSSTVLVLRVLIYITVVPGVLVLYWSTT